MKLSFNKQNRQMEQGEELLGSSYSPKIVPGVANAVLGIDGGSTQTRVTIFPKGEFDNLDKLEKQYVIPSSHSELNSYEEILAQSNVLYDNMDTWISCITHDANAPFERMRTLRGTKSMDANTGESRINSTVQKIDTIGFYLNLIDAIGYALVMDSEVLNEEYNVYIGITLPPDNVTSNLNREKFYSKLKRSFSWENKDLGISLKINIKGVELQTEPEAVRKGHVTKYDIEEPGTTLIVECGGSTVGTAILKGFTVINPASQTFNYGGTQLQDSLADLFKDKFGGGNLNRESLKLALEKGTIRAKGKGIIDVTDLCIEAKKDMASTIHQDIITNVFDRISNKGISIEDIDNVIFSGRMVRPGSYREDESGYSVAEELQVLFSKDIPEANFYILDTNLIPYGNAIAAYLKFGSVLETTEETPNLEVATSEEEV